MHKKVRAAIKKTIERDAALERPKEKQFGHFATPVAFSLAKEWRKNPMQIADELTRSFLELEMFDRVESIKGYINFKLSDSFLDEYASWALSHEDEFASGEDGQRILLEFVSANPTGPLHIGHARGAIFGDALLKIGRHLGHDITAEYYINDAGSQIGMLGLSIWLAGREHILKTDVEYPEEYYKGEYIVDIAVEAGNQFGASVFESEENIEKLSLFGKDAMMEEVRSNLASVGIVFDHFVSEKSLYPRWDETKEQLDRHAALYEKEGKIWLKTSEHGDEKDRVVVRETGEPTYLAGDIIYHGDKYDRGFDHYINIWGADHHGYINRVKSSIRYLGHDDKKLEILLSQMVSLLKGGEPYKMSKRAGNFILMRDVVEEIGPGPLRFVFLSKKSDTHLEFDVDELSKTDASNPYFYINYAHARVYSLFAKAEKNFDDVRDIQLKEMDDDTRDLLFQALLLPQVLEDAFSVRQVQKVPEYLKNLASQFHKFYNDHKIVDSEQEEVYLKVFTVVALSIRVGLRLLGIEAQQRM